MATNEQMKERALFYIDRRLSALETEGIDHKSMAERGIPYSDRQLVEAQLKEKQEKQQHELEAMQWLRDKLLEL